MAQEEQGVFRGWAQRLRKVKGSSGLNASASTFTYDLNLSGTDTITDIAIAKANTGQTLP